MDDVRKLGAELEADARGDATRAPPKGNVPVVDKNVSSTLSCKFGGGDVKDVRTAAQAVGVNQDVGVTPRRDQRQRPQIVHANRKAQSQRERSRDDGPTNRQSRCIPLLALQAMAQPPADAYAHPYPPIETFEHAKCTCRGAEMAGSSRMAHLRDPREHEQRHVNTN